MTVEPFELPAVSGGGLVDPDETLARLVDLVAAVNSTGLASHRETYDAARWWQSTAEGLAEGVDDLHGWLAAGGVLPGAWRPSAEVPSGGGLVVSCTEGLRGSYFWEGVRVAYPTVLRVQVSDADRCPLYAFNVAFEQPCGGRPVPRVQVPAGSFAAFVDLAPFFAELAARERTRVYLSPSGVIAMLRETVRAVDVSAR